MNIASEDDTIASTTTTTDDQQSDDMIEVEVMLLNSSSLFLDLPTKMFLNFIHFHYTADNKM